MELSSLLKGKGKKFIFAGACTFLLGATNFFGAYHSTSLALKAIGSEEGRQAAEITLDWYAESPYIRR